MVRYRIRMFGNRMVVLIAKPGRLAVQAACVFACTPHGGGPAAADEAATQLTSGSLATLGSAGLEMVSRLIG